MYGDDLKIEETLDELREQDLIDYDCYMADFLFPPSQSPQEEW